MWQIIMTAIAVSVDGFWGGFAFGLRKTRTPFFSLIIIAAWSVLCTGITMLGGHYFARFIPVAVATWIGAGLLMVIGIIAIREGLELRADQPTELGEGARFSPSTLLKIVRNPLLADIDKCNDIKPSEGTLLGLAVAMDASVAAFALALEGINPYTTPFLFGLTHFLLIGMGNIIARQRLLARAGNRFALVPGLILIFLGVIRLL